MSAFNLKEKCLTSKGIRGHYKESTFYNKPIMMYIALFTKTF